MLSEGIDLIDFEDFASSPIYDEIDTPKFGNFIDNDNYADNTEKNDFTPDICEILIKSEKERRKLTLEDLTRVVMSFIKKHHPKGDILNSIELLRFLVYKIGLEEKKIKRRMYDVLQVLSGCGILKKINRKIFFVCV